MQDELNPQFMFQGTATDLLVAATKGEIDLNQLVAKELAGRGLDKDGKWVGFAKAEVIHGIKK